MSEREFVESDRESLPKFRELATEALKYWEPRRIVYNVALAAVVIFYFVLAWPGSRAVFSLDAVLFLFLLAVVANICYSAGYVVDVFVQLSSPRFFALGFFQNTP